MNLKEALKNRLSKKEISLIPRSFDIIGSIAIIDVPENLIKKEKIIADALLSVHTNVKTVLKKAGKVRGRLRTRKLKFISGIKTKETLYKETNCLMKLDVERGYFSPRLSNDRIDVMKQVKAGERVLVMFSGIAPYALVIAKNTKAREVYAVELNRIASKYAEENAKLNKLKNIKIIQGDVKKVIPRLKRKKIFFDRIVMARPQLKDDFLSTAFRVSKKGTTIHFHDFLLEEDMPDVAINKIKKAAKVARKQIKILGWKKALEIGPRKWRIRVDFRLA